MPGQSELERRIETFLGEFRIMVPALGALLGFQLIVAYQQSYEQLGFADRAANFAAVVSSALALLFLLVPASYHRAMAGLHESEAFLVAAQRHFGMGFVFFALSLTLSLYLQAERSFHSPPFSAGAAAAFLGALVVAWGLYPRRKARRQGAERHGRAPRRGERGAT